MAVQCTGQSQKIYQLFEAVLESLPEVIMQELEKADGGVVDVLTLVVISVIASLISITNKYVWIDELMVVWQCESFGKSTSFWKDYSNFSQMVWKQDQILSFMQATASHRIHFEFMKDYIEKNGEMTTVTRAKTSIKTGEVYNYKVWSKIVENVDWRLCKINYDKKKNIEYCISLRYGYIIRVIWRLSAVIAQFDGHVLV